MIGGSQLLIIAIVLIVLVVAPAKLPGLGKSLAEAIRGFKKGMREDDTTDVTESVKREKLDENNQNESVTSTQKEKDKV